MEIEISWEGTNHPFTLVEGEQLVGRSSENDIQIPMPRVSKRHAVIRLDGERIFVRDLGSSNGTEINGKPTGESETEFPEGAIVSFAGALMRRVGSSVSLVTLKDDRHVTTKLRYNIRQGYSTGARDRIVDHSAELFELLASGQDAVEVETAACKFVGRCVTADRVVLLEDDGEGTAIEVRARWIRSGNDDAPLQLSSTIVNQVTSQRDSILVSDPAADPRFGAQHSIMALNLRSAMAAPLFDNERVRGILYVDTTDSKVRYGEDDLQVLTSAANAVAVKLRNLSFERELDTAAKIQREMITRNFKMPDGYELDAHQVMCRAVGGDLYHFATRPDGKILLTLGDVSGKGMPAALAMSAATVLIGMLSEIEGSMLELATRLHRQLFRSLAPEQFMTAFIGELDPETGHMTYVNAGHEPPLILRGDGELEELDSTGLPIAMIEDIMLEQAETTLHPGDVFTVFSDGIPEATISGDSFLGLDAIREEMKAAADRPLEDVRDSILRHVDTFLDGQPSSDDLTLLLLRRQK